MLRFRIVILCLMSFQALGAASFTGFGWWCCGESAVRVVPINGTALIPPFPRGSGQGLQGPSDSPECPASAVRTATSPSSVSAAMGSPAIATPLLRGAQPARGRLSSAAYSRAPTTMTAWSDSVPWEDWKQPYVGPYVKFIKSLIQNGGIVPGETVQLWVNAHVRAIFWISQEEHKASLEQAVMKKLQDVIEAAAGSAMVIAEESPSLARQVLLYAPVIEGQDTRPYYTPFINLIFSLSNHKQKVIPDGALLSFITAQVNAMPWRLGSEIKPAFIAEIIRAMETRPASPALYACGLTSDEVPLSPEDLGLFPTDSMPDDTGAGVGLPGQVP